MTHFHGTRAKSAKRDFTFAFLKPGNVFLAVLLLLRLCTGTTFTDGKQKELEKMFACIHEMKIR